jgi:hypothetical protein
MLRFATPVFIDGNKPAGDDKKPDGLVIFNLQINTKFFLHNKTKSETLENYMLVDQKGFYLHHPDTTKEWGMMKQLKRSHHNVKKDYPEVVAKQILSGIIGVRVKLISRSQTEFGNAFLDAPRRTINKLC